MVKLIQGTTSHFISIDGYCFKMQGLKEKKIPMEIIRGTPKVKIMNNRKNLLLLMIEHFVELEAPHYKTSFTLEDGRLPLKNIKIRYIKNYDSKDLDSINLFKYKCSEKAKDNNQRVSYSSTLTALDILNCLKRNNFKCFYCNEFIETKTWHLDHVIPISKGGLNSNENIVSSCKECNLMKGALDLRTFYKKCYNITKTHQASKGCRIIVTSKSEEVKNG